MKTFLIVLLIIVIGTGAYLFGKNNGLQLQEQKKIISENSITTTTTSTSVSTPNKTTEKTTTTTTQETKLEDGWRSYSNTSLGFSFQYPSDWTVTENKVKKTVTIATNDIGETVEGQSFPSQSITFTATGKSYFNPPVNTKFGSTTYSDSMAAIMVDDQCAKTEALFGNSSVKAVRFGGSLMSDPAYMDYAIQTKGGEIVIVHESMGAAVTTDMLNTLKKIADSLKLLNGNSFYVPACAQ